MTDTQTRQDENQHLRERLEELEETLRAIRSGEVDALVVSRPEGEQVYTLKGALEPYRVMVEVMSEGAVTLAQDGTILYCNSRFAQLVKTPHERIAGLPLHRWIAAADQEKFNKMRVQGWNNLVRGELTIQAGDASQVPVHFSMSPLPESAGEGIAAVITDLTDVVAAAEARMRQRESEEQFKYMFDHSPIGKSITTPSGVIQVNQALCEMLGYTEEELQNRSWRDITHPDDIGATQLEVDALLAGKQQSARFVNRYLHKNGSVVWADVSTSLRRGEAGQPLYFMTHIMDITERKREEEEIRRLNADLERRVAERTAELESFAYSVSHDLRVPLRAIGGFSRLVLKQYEGKLDDEGKRLLNVVCDNTQKLEQLIDDILAFSRTGRLEIKAMEADMEALVREVWQELEPSIAGRETRLDIKHMPKVRGDPAMLRQVWANLLGNAAKFTSSRTTARIEVGSSEQDGECIFYVKDNGVGFDMQYVDRLFGVFQRLHRVEEFVGSGIGLAIVKRIVTKHGGRVWAESKVNEGATFYFSLPKG